ncbi:MAG: lipopolysaccharide heptosyltransferase II, partial [Verrucomicrobiae bacterium]|nr:lipopolysaccharide heptosyltransferase II [Verrucomicrobiae bacterium]
TFTTRWRGFVMSERILVRAANWVGDSVMMMPAVARLREKFPQAEIAVLCPEKLRDLWQYNPCVNRVTARVDGRFDVAYVFPNSFRSAWEVWRAKIPRRIGYAGHWRRWLLTEVVAGFGGERARYERIAVGGKVFRRKVFGAVRHQVYRHLALVGGDELLEPRIWLGPDEAELRKGLLGERPGPLFVIHPGAEYGAAKCWPAERFAEVARRVRQQTGCCVVVVGQGRQVCARWPEGTLNLFGRTTLLELCAVLKAARVFLTNDTGPMHLAAALDVPQVCLFGSTSPELTGPLSHRAVVLRRAVECSPCFLRRCPIDFRCMMGLSVDEVTGAVLRLFGAEECCDRAMG